MSKNWFSWNGVKSTQYGLYVSEQPPMTRPTERVSYVSVPGRSGSLTKLEGEDVFEDLTLTTQCVLKDGKQIAAINQWLRGSGKVEFANREGGWYEGRISNQIPFEQVLRGRENLSCSVIFRVKPFWHPNDEADITLTTSGGTVTNEGNVLCYPVITVTGTGDVTLMVNQTLIELTGLTGSITIDSELMEAYNGQTNMNGSMSGDFPTLSVGSNAISWTGTVTKVTVRKNTRYLK